ncbi:hypothetical protein AU194_29680 [Mycobacterium sp. GA-2829]|nr:hypothetical protein AU194_29680 [Mycobacterium sp. GA-2829]
MRSAETTTGATTIRGENRSPRARRASSTCRTVSIISGIARIVSASPSATCSTGNPNRAEGRMARVIAVSMSVVRVLNVTAAANATDSVRIPHTTSARRQSVNSNWKPKITSTTQNTGRSCDTTTFAGIRAAARTPSTPSTATPRCTGVSTNTDIAAIRAPRPSSLTPAGNRCSSERPGR